MSVTQQEFDAAQQQLVTDVDVIHQFVTADDTTVVDDGNGGSIPSMKKVVKDTVGDLSALAHKDGSNAIGTWPVSISGKAANADNATHATNADAANTATHATSADTATSANHATTADSATTASTVTTVTQSQVQNALGGAVVMASAKGAANGVCELDANQLVPAIRLPSYVDDVIESATKAALPATGESGKIYVVIADESRSNTTTQYRWTGSTYARIVSSPGSTDEVAEGATNLYFTGARVLNAVLAGLSTASAVAATAADSVLVAIGKLQAQATANAANIATNTTNVGNNTTAITNLTPYAKTYDFHGFAAGKPAAAATLLFVKAGRAFSLPANLTGSQFKAKTAATASAAITLYKNGASFATITFAAGAVTATVVATATSFAAGDELTASAPATQDSTLADIAMTLLASQV